MSTGPWQIIVVALVVLLLFGNRHLGTLGRQLGRGVRNFKKALRPGGDVADAADVDWVKSAAKVAKTAQRVKKVGRLGRFLL